MTLVVNGQTRELSAPFTLLHLLEDTGFPPAALLVEHNGVALLREEWESVVLNDGDRLELLKIVAGG